MLLNVFIWLEFDGHYIYIYQQPAETISGRQKYLKKTSHTEGTGLHVYNMVHICSIMDVSP